MRILDISSQRLFPPDTGGANVIYLFVKYLSRIHDVHVITTKNESHFSYASSLTVHDILIDNPIKKFLYPSVFFQFIRLIQRIRPDAVIIHFPWYGLFFGVLKHCMSFRFILHEQNVEYLRFQRTGASWWPFLKLYERLVCRLADQVICLSDIDRDIFIESLGVDPDKISVNTYGFDGDKFAKNIDRVKAIRQEISPQNRPIVLFFGKLDYPPNAEALDLIRTHLIPGLSARRTDCTFLIVGGPIPSQASRDEKNADIQYVGHKTNIADYIHASDAVVVPILAGSGVRTKIIESIGCGKTVISTSPGAEGIDRDACGELLKIADDWDLFVDQTASVLEQGEEKKIPTAFLEQYDILF